ncbi:unnamed protein product [Prorocentrum cordatum]|uniref:Uncharacterized protein n=1 Tax=Prorocentrum cordatum TaxID=2364126 RepID=A0ABN9RC53_9DINO|nr:unnamed protein product [Polarella glacialis]
MLQQKQLVIAKLLEGLANAISASERVSIEIDTRKATATRQHGEAQHFVEESAIGAEAVVPKGVAGQGTMLLEAAVADKEIEKMVEAPQVADVVETVDIGETIARK